VHARGQEVCADKQLACFTQCANGLVSASDRCIARCNAARDSCFTQARAVGSRAEVERTRVPARRAEPSGPAVKRIWEDPARYRR
jgi:hypothetical protein